MTRTPEPYGSLRERFTWVSSYEEPDHPELERLDEQMERFYRWEVTAHRYHETAEASNRDWLNGDYGFQETVLRRIASRELVVEFSCGSGYAAKFFRAVGARYVGFDLNLDALSRTRLRDGESSLVVGNGYRAPIRSAAADWVVCFFVIEHVVWPARYLDEMLRVAKPGARIALAFPDYVTNIRRISGSIRLGRSPGRMRAKVRSGRWLDVLQHGFERLVLYPRRVRPVHRDIFGRGRVRFLINVHPECLAAPWSSDTDAVHFACEEEIVAYLARRGCAIELRSRDVRGCTGGSLDAATSGNGFVLARVAMRDAAVDRAAIRQAPSEMHAR